MTGYQVFADGREFGKDYATKSAAQAAVAAYKPHFPGVKYTIRAIPRCTSRCPKVGYLRCEKALHHDYVCEAGGYRWWRGRGHSKPTLTFTPEWAR